VTEGFRGAKRLAESVTGALNARMKKILVWLSIGVAVFIVAIVIGISFFLDGAVKRGVETFGPQMTKVPVTLEKVSISTLSGSGTMEGLIVGNPEGFKTPNAISVGSATLALKPTSVFGDKIIVRKIELIEPQITFEGGFGGNNLSKILANLEESTGGSDTNAAAEPDEGPNQKLQVDEFTIRGARLNVSITGMGGKSLPVTLPNIQLTGLGTGPDGITATELVRRLLKEIEKTAVQEAEKAMSQLGTSAVEMGKELGKGATGSLTNVTGGLRDLLKKK